MDRDSTCLRCDDMGVIASDSPYNPNPGKGAVICPCSVARRLKAITDAAAIPEHYQDAELDNYLTSFPNAHPDLWLALMTAKRYVEEYPTLTQKGLLIHGNLGTGKTHLAVGIIIELMRRYRLSCYFADQQTFFLELQASYGKNPERTTREVLKPALDSEVLLFDDLGATQLTDWSMNTAATILSMRYNRNRTTILTTNYPVEFTPRGASVSVAELSDAEKAARATRDSTLGEQIGDRILSRVLEMCRQVRVLGADFRTLKKQ